jgi:hypothetical protein
VRASPLKSKSSGKLLKRRHDEIPNSEEENWSDDDSLDDYSWDEEVLEVQIVSVRTAQNADQGNLNKKPRQEDRKERPPEENGPQDQNAVQ